MVKPRFRARTFRRVFKKTPGGRTVLHYERRKNRAGICSMCGAKLNRAKTTRKTVRKLSKTEKRAERPYPNLCSKCMRELMKKKAREIVQ